MGEQILQGLIILQSGLSSWIVQFRERIHQAKHTWETEPLAIPLNLNPRCRERIDTHLVCKNLLAQGASAE